MNRHPGLAAYDRSIDEAYRRWVETLAAPLQSIAFALPHHIGHARSRWRSWRQVFPTPATRALPWLVAEGFPAVSPAAGAQLCAAYVFGAFLALIDDRLIDRQAAFSRNLNLVRRCLEAEVLRCLAIVGRHEGFWRLYRHAFRQYAAAHAREPQLWRGTGARAGHSRYVRESAAKTAIARVPVVAIGVLGGATPAGLSRLEQLVDHYLVAMQYADDVADWEDDFRSGRWTYFIQQHLSAAEARRTAPVTLAELRVRVAAAATTEDFLCRASWHYAACIRASRAFAVPRLRAWVGQRRDQLRTLAVERQCARQQPQRALVQELERAWLS